MVQQIWFGDVWDLLIMNCTYILQHDDLGQEEHTSVLTIDSAQLLLCSCAMKRKAVSGQVADSSIELEVSLPSGRFETVAVH